MPQAPGETCQRKEKGKRKSKRTSGPEPEVRSLLREREKKEVFVIPAVPLGNICIIPKKYGQIMTEL